MCDCSCAHDCVRSIVQHCKALFWLARKSCAAAQVSPTHHVVFLQVPEGKGENDFACNGKWLSAADALDIINECHGQVRAHFTHSRSTPACPHHILPCASHTHTYA